MKRTGYLASAFAIAFISIAAVCGHGAAADAPAPLLRQGDPVDWWFAFKFNTKSFPGCPAHATRVCLFGGDVQDYPRNFSLQSIYASSRDTSFTEGKTCLGNTATDPVGATFDQVYNGSYNYVIWNDQFYDDPDLAACRHKTSCDSPWAHSKGMLAWDDDGNGFVMQVSTPNWPGAGSKEFPRQHNGNTLGCITDDTGKPQDNIWVSQHFLALKLNIDDLVAVLNALIKASVVTMPNAGSDTQSQLIRNGGPGDVQELVHRLGKLSEDTDVSKVTLSSGVVLIAKPPNLHVPPWQMVSALLGGEPLTVATWLTGSHKILDTTAKRPKCWDASLDTPGAVTNAEMGEWNSTNFGLTGGPSPDRNHAKIGVSSKSGTYAIFGDLNQEGTLSEPCDVSQNTRGGLFYILQDGGLAGQLRSLLGVSGSKALSDKGTPGRHHR